MATALQGPGGQDMELADPVVSGIQRLEGTPSEVKLKYLADNRLAQGRGAEKAIEEYIRNKKGDLVRCHGSPGHHAKGLPTIGSLCDLSPRKRRQGTPIVYIRATSIIIQNR